MKNEIVTGPDGRKWTRSDDRTRLVCEDGTFVLGNPEMPTDYLLSVGYLSDSQVEEQPVAPAEAPVEEPAESTGIVGTTVNWIKNLF